MTAPALAWLGLAGSGPATDDARRGAVAARRGGARVRRRRRLVRLPVGRRARGPQGGRRLGEQSPSHVRGPRSLSEPESSEHSRGPARPARSPAGSTTSRACSWHSVGRVGRDSGLWYAHFELGLAEAALGQRRAALRELRAAAKLNPQEEVITQVARLVRRGRPIDRRAIDTEFVRRIRAKVGP